ncbi:MAG: hypothetical protein OZSIB_2823 [Candidatus Ozemobacter sibiricus]|uniref:Uncharacterized protein n=1 Tax=Candidatus Ozemobacter sibiricus TaxID=2268124 RepID=A0A367ZS18_9BACT|nr:MAG: hypothetical protein OZSIB_2823 [Candidatus Ozemobacter sibiricus]
MDRYCCTTAMSINTDANPNSYTFVVSSYPGPNPQEDYYIKSQGSFYDSEILATTTAQVWAYARIDTPLENVNLIRFGPMPIQPLSLDSAAGVNDFWDWERF